MLLGRGGGILSTPRAGAAVFRHPGPAIRVVTGARAGAVAGPEGTDVEQVLVCAAVPIGFIILGCQNDECEKYK